VGRRSEKQVLFMRCAKTPEKTDSLYHLLNEMAGRNLREFEREAACDHDVLSSYIPSCGGIGEDGGFHFKRETPTHRGKWHLFLKLFTPYPDKLIEEVDIRRNGNRFSVVVYQDVVVFHEGEDWDENGHHSIGGYRSIGERNIITKRSAELPQDQMDLYFEGVKALFFPEKR